MRQVRTLLVGLLIAVGLGVGSGYYALDRAIAEVEAIRAGLPTIDPPGAYRPALKTQVMAADGTLLTEIYRENRELLPLEQIPRHIINATIASEDRRFREHIGVSPRDVARAAIANLQHRNIVQGGSTITQQLARDLYLSRRQTMRRKLREALLAIEIERQYSKDEILELYLNQINYGKGAYGVRTAARMYFGKEPPDLSLGECAALASIPQRPADYNLYDAGQHAITRRNRVLGAMAELGFITPVERDEAKREKLVIRAYEPPNWEPRRAPYYTSWAVRKLVELLGEDTVYHGGLRVWTCLDLDLQAVAEKAVRRAVRRNAGRGASQGAAVMIEPTTGRVLCLVGGVDWEKSQFNRATQALRQPGSAFKMFVYATAIERGYRPTDTLKDEPFRLDLPNGEVWEPKNYDGRWHGEVTLQEAFAKSINIPAVRLLDRVGIEPVIHYAQRMGIRSPLRPYLSLALGTSEVTLLELTSAYGVFPAGGYRTEPTFLVRIEDDRGRVIYEHQPLGTAVLTPRTVQLMLAMLQEVMRSGTGKPAALDVPCGGKTGTTQNGRDAWFVGFTPRLVCGVWLGNDTRKRMYGVYGGSGCGPAWNAIMSAAIRRTGAGTFAEHLWPQAVTGAPRGYEVEITPEEAPWEVEVEVCLDTGLRATPYCPRTERKRFKKGDDPTEPCTVHDSLAPEETAPAQRPAPPVGEAPAPAPAAAPEPTPVELSPPPTTPPALEPAPPATPPALEPAPPTQPPGLAEPQPPPKAAPAPQPPAPLLNQFVICKDSGLLAKPTCPRTEVREMSPGTAPTKECDLH